MSNITDFGWVFDKFGWFGRSVSVRSELHRYVLAVRPSFAALTPVRSSYIRGAPSCTAIVLAVRPIVRCAHIAGTFLER